MFLALKIDVDTLRGTREGVPGLVTLLRKHDVGATFLFSLGPDHTGRAIRRAFRPGFVGKVRRTSVVRHYGFKTLLYGTALPGPLTYSGPNGAKINPWRYNASSPKYNAATFDLWMDVMVGDKTNRICNWSDKPLVVGAPYR